MRSSVNGATKPVMKLDLRPKKLGVGFGEIVYVSRSIDAAGGTVAPEDVYVAELGTLMRVIVPAGVLTAPTDVFFATAAAPPLDDPHGQRAFGVAMRVGPDRRTFAQPLVVHVPYEAGAVPADFDPVRDVRVLSVGKDGSREVLVPTGAGTNAVIVESSRTATFLPFIARTRPGIASQSFTEMRLAFELVPGAFNDSRVRRITASRAFLSFDGANGLTGSSTGATIEISHDDDAKVTFTTTPFTDVEEPVGTWTLGATSVDAVVGADAVRRFISDDGAFLVRRTSDAGGTVARFGVAIRTPPSLSAFRSPMVASGTYAIGVLGVGFRTGSRGPADLAIVRQFGTLKLKVDPRIVATNSVGGTWSASAKAVGAFVEGGTGGLLGRRFGAKAGGTFTLDPGGALNLRLDEDDEQPVRLVVSADGSTIAGIQASAQGAEEPAALLIVGTRRGKVTSAPDELYLAGELGLVPLSYEIASASPLVVPDLSVLEAERTLSFEKPTVGEGGFAQNSVEVSVVTQSGVATEHSTSPGTDVATKFAVGKTGAVSMTGRASGKFAGAVGPGGQLGFALPTGTDPLKRAFLLVFVRSAPPP
jgi:hypothetical protein